MKTKGRRYRIKMDNSLKGLLVEVIRQSKVTGEVVVRLLENRERISGATGSGWKVGDTLQVKDYELE